MNKFLKLKRLFLFFILCWGAAPLWAGPADWSFLPASTIFKPTIGDPREYLTGFTGYLDQVEYVGQVGTYFEFVRYAPEETTQFGWGLFGAGFILLGEDGDTFPMMAGDWYVGTYFSAVLDDFSMKLAVLHESGHLGDSYQYIASTPYGSYLDSNPLPIFYSRENFNYTLSWQPNDYLRLYGGAGDWFDINPVGNPYFAFVGTELYTPYWSIDNSVMRAYVTAHFRYQGEIQTFNNEFQLGLQWKNQKNGGRDIRFALIYYTGDNPFAQFYNVPDSHWGLSTFFDF
jgi:hypothetical protein